MKDYYSKFVSNQFYHIYNRANGSEILFREPKNYQFFLKRWNKYLNEIVDVWAYCLMPNHFHFLVKVLEPNGDLKGFENLSGLVSNQFSKLFNSYTKSFNSVYNRHGSLFQKPFKHVLVDSQNYLLTLIYYIHHNPIHHGFTENYVDWSWSSYPAIVGNSKTKVQRNKVIDLFGDREAFIFYFLSRTDKRLQEN